MKRSRTRHLAALLKKRVDIPRSWLLAPLFACKVCTVAVAAFLLFWYASLPSTHLSPDPLVTAYSYFNSPTADFLRIASALSVPYFLAAAFLLVGGLIQLARPPLQPGFRTIGFAVFALIIATILATRFSPLGGILSATAMFLPLT